MEDKIKILHLEDLSADAELVARELRKGGIDYELLVVNNKAKFINALNEFSPDIILSDHSLPSFDSHEALRLLKQAGIEAPFILITATMTEEFAVEIMKQGADDYLLKDRLNRLPSAVINAMEKHRLKEEQRFFIKSIIDSEARLNEAQALVHISSWEIDMVRNVPVWSDEFYKIFGIEKGEVQPSTELFLSFMHPDDADFSREKVREGFETLNASSFNFRFLRKDNTLRYGYVEWRFEFDSNKKPSRLFGILQDITERRLAEMEREKMIEDMIQRNRDLEQFTYIISHNLRAPTANIIGIAEVLQDNSLSPEIKKELLDGLSLSVSTLDTVIRDLNVILQVKQEINERKETINFSTLVENILISIGNLITEHRVLVRPDFSDVEEMYSLKGYMHSIFYNLIINSVKYRRENEQPVIEIKSRKETGKIILTFKDNGIGIDMKANGDKIFGLYKRFHAHVEGKGIGLFMVKTQVESLGGKISVQSELGQGTTFTIEFKNEY